MSLIIIFFLLLIFVINFIFYWQYYFKKRKYKQKSSQTFSHIMISTMLPIPIINSGYFDLIFKENFSYFGQYRIGFLVMGIVFIVIGIKFRSLAFKTLNIKKIDNKQHLLKRKGIYEIARHPIYLSWILMFLGISFIFDSFIGLILCPLLTIFIELLASFEEKYILIPKFGKDYENYKKKTPNRLISQPYNYLLIIIGIFVIYIGFLNLNNFALFS